MKPPFLAILLLLPLWVMGCEPSEQKHNPPAGPEEVATPAPGVSPSPSDPQRKSVLDYYRSLKPPYASPYALRQEGERWLTTSTADYEIEATVDLRNGFIEIVDEGTGGGTEKVQVVLFRLADGAPMIAISQQSFDGIGESQTYHFLRPEDPEQYDWTEHTLGVIGPYDFLELDYAEEPDLLEEALPVLIDLPQYGTALTARISTSKRFLYCGDQASAEQHLVCPAFDRLRRTEFQLSWDREAGQFHFPAE
ncbi:MAG: hypothetical protein D6722_13505 [Bacteroidetes bacterium]|nr:MAG: hypothetical protein D6722_13505 [Bacteroidota bacterium]